MNLWSSSTVAESIQVAGLGIHLGMSRDIMFELAVEIVIANALDIKLLVLLVHLHMERKVYFHESQGSLCM